MSKQTTNKPITTKIIKNMKGTEKNIYAYRL